MSVREYIVKVNIRLEWKYLVVVQEVTMLNKKIIVYEDRVLYRK